MRGHGYDWRRLGIVLPVPRNGRGGLRPRSGRRGLAARAGRRGVAEARAARSRARREPGEAPFRARSRVRARGRGVRAGERVRPRGPENGGLRATGRGGASRHRALELLVPVPADADRQPLPQAGTLHRRPSLHSLLPPAPGRGGGRREDRSRRARLVGGVLRGHRQARPAPAQGDRVLHFKPPAARGGRRDPSSRRGGHLQLRRGGPGGGVGPRPALGLHGSPALPAPRRGPRRHPRLHRALRLGGTRSPRSAGGGGSGGDVESPGHGDAGIVARRQHPVDARVLPPPPLPPPDGAARTSGRRPDRPPMHFPFGPRAGIACEARSAAGGAPE